MSDRLTAALAELAAAIRAELAADHAPSSAPDRLLSVDEAAAALGVRRTTLYGELQAGRVRSMRIGRRRLIPSSAIAERMKGAPLHNGTPLEVDRRDRSTTAPAS